VTNPKRNEATTNRLAYLPQCDVTHDALINSMFGEFKPPRRNLLANLLYHHAENILFLAPLTPAATI
jgi:hypothetical protein